MQDDKLVGYTKRIYAYGGAHDFELLVKPDADLEGTFKAWDCVDEVFVKVNGWMFDIDHD